MKTLLDRVKTVFENYSSNELDEIWASGNHLDEIGPVANDFLRGFRFDTSPPDDDLEKLNFNTNLGSKIFEPFLLNIIYGYRSIPT